MVPSVVLVREDGGVLTGEAAVRRALIEPGRVAREFKRRIGDSIPVLLGGSPFSAEALTSHLLGAVLEQVIGQEGERPSAVVISHPANWGPFKIDLLKQAVRMADLEVPVSYVTEPEAAAIGYGRERELSPGQTVAVYDLGGGTFDAAVLRRTPGGFTILGQPEGIERLGGIDVDAAVYAHVAQVIGEPLAVLDEDDPTAVSAVARLRAECTTAKESLSSDVDTVIPVLLPGYSGEVRLTRAELEAMVRPSLYDSIRALERALRSADVTPNDLSAVLLVGGSSRMPLVAQLVGAELGCPVAVNTHPKHVIAVGAAWLASARAAAAASAAASAAPAVRRPAEVYPVSPASPATPPAPVVAAAVAPAVAAPEPDEERVWSGRAAAVGGIIGAEAGVAGVAGIEAGAAAGSAAGGAAPGVGALAGAGTMHAGGSGTLAHGPNGVFSAHAASGPPQALTGHGMTQANAPQALTGHGMTQANAPQALTGHGMSQANAPQALTGHGMSQANAPQALAGQGIAPQPLAGHVTIPAQSLKTLSGPSGSGGGGAAGGGGAGGGSSAGAFGLARSGATRVAGAVRRAISSQQLLAGVAAGAAALLIVTAGYFASQRDREDTVVAVGEPQVTQAPLSGPTASSPAVDSPPAPATKNPGNPGIVGNGVSTVNQAPSQGTDSGGGAPKRQGGDAGGDTGKPNPGAGGAATAVVPSVVNLRLAQAQSTLNGAGFKVSVSYRAVTDGAQDDVVLGQDPGERTTVYAGSTVRITVGQLGTVAVPTVVDQSRDSAERQVNDAGLKSSVSYQKVDDPAKDDVVLSQSPNGGAQAKAGDTVRLTVGQINTTQVPGVVNLPLADAQGRLNSAKLRSSVTEQEVQDKAKDGIVLAQDRAPGSTVNVGTDVTLTVGHYVGTTTVPSVVGMLLADAQKQLEARQLRYTVSYYDLGDASGQDGVVRSQTPVGGNVAKLGDTVALVVNRKTTPPPCTVLAVGKQAVGQAQPSLEKAGFKVSVTYQTVTDPALKDVVLSQSPAGGSVVACGSTVALTVGRVEAPPPGLVPNVVGQPEAGAVGAINNAQFKASVTTQSVSDQTQDGKVVSQKPAGGTQAPSGSTVTLTIGKYSPPAPPPAAKVGVPAVVNQSQAAAQKQITGANLKSSVTTQTVTDQTKDGIVLAQSPAGGTQVDAGSTVTLTVGKYTPPAPAQVTVPNLAGDTQSGAQSKLSNAGLAMSVAPGSATSGVVVQQSPAAGAKVDAGTTVVVTIDVGIG